MEDAGKTRVCGIQMLDRNEPMNPVEKEDLFTTAFKKFFWGSIILLGLTALLIWGVGIVSGELSPWILLWLPIAVAFNSFLMALLAGGVTVLGDRIHRFITSTDSD